MPVVEIGVVWMRMLQRLMPVRMGMRLATVPGKLVSVLVMGVVQVFVEVLHLLVRMRVLVMLG